MNDKGQVNKTVSVWDKRLCTRLDNLWHKHQAGELEVVDAKALLKKAKTEVERTIKEQQQVKRIRFNVQTPEYAV